ncbi:MAG: ABC transporter ATP-binding protein [Acidimicrobiia bacterium]
MSAVNVVGLGLTLGGNRILETIDLRVDPGEWLGLIGPNGAGKTSLLQCIGGSLPFEGEISIDGNPIRAIGHRRLARLVARVPQSPIVPTGMSVTDYVLLGRTPHLGYFAREGRADLAAVREAMAFMEVEALAGRVLDTLSGGELQRVVLARALAQEAALLLLDEPTSALDVGHRVAALEQVEQLRRARELTVVSALHDLTLAAQFCDRLALIAGGRIVATGPARAVLTEVAIRQHYGADVTLLEGPDGVVVVIPVRRRAPAIAEEAIT